MFVANSHPARINMAGLHAGMQAAGLDLLLGSSLENFFYVADSWHLSQQIIPERLCFAVLSMDQEPGIVACYCEETQLRTDSWITDVETYLEHREHPIQVLAQFIRERYGDSLRIGIEKRFLAYAYCELLAELLPKAKLLAGDQIFDQARAIKTEAEQGLLTQAGLDTEQAILSTFQWSRPGITEKEMADTLAAQILSQGAMSPWLVLAAGANTAINHPHPSSKRLLEGETLRVDVGGYFQGYQSDVARTAVVGTASPEQQSVYQRLRESERETIAALRAGVPARDIYLLAQKSLDDRGLALTSQAVGHNLGVGMHEHPILHAHNDTELAAGMIINIEPAVKDTQGFLYHLEDLVLVTEGEPVILTTLMNTEQLFCIGSE